MIHKDEFAYALFKAQNQSNIFADKVSLITGNFCDKMLLPDFCASFLVVLQHLVTQVFEVFDTKKNNVIGFDEFVRAVSVFHPNAPLQEKADCKSDLLHCVHECCHLTKNLCPVLCIYQACQQGRSI